MRTFVSGATRDTDNSKIDFHGFLDPAVLKMYGEYMLKHQVQADGTLRSSENWKKGIPKEVYMSSLLRHIHDLWMFHDGYEGRETVEDAISASLFNLMGYAYEYLKENK